MTSPQAFQKTLMSSFKAYLPEEHWDLVKWNAAGLLIVPSVLKMSMYGTEEELAANVQLFRRFPGSHMYFDSEPTELTTYNAMYCKSLKNKEYVFKQDIYNVLSTVVFSSTVDPDVVPLISFYLRTKEKQLNGKFEMVQHLNEELNKFDDMLITALENSEDSNKKPRLKRGTLSEIFASVKQLLPKNDDDPEYKSIHNLLKDYAKKKLPKKHSNYYERLLNVTELIIGIIEKFMNDYPTWFVQEAPGSHGPAIVRLFEDGAQKFVLARELLDAMERAQMMSAELWKTEVMENMPELATFDFMELFKMLDKKDMQEIEFVRTPIRRTKHRVIFIPYHAGGYIIPAVDLLMELIHDTISVRKILQDVTEDKLSIICDILLNCFTTEEVKDLRFVKLTQVEKMKKDVLTQLQERVPDAFLKHKQEVYRVGLQGFTLKDLQNELERLGLVKTFPFIVEDYSEFVFEWTELEKKEEVLRTCDMHDALELCQRYALLSRHMELVDFLHYSGACSRLKMKCHRCRDAAAAKKEQTEKELEEKKGEGSNCQKEDDQVETLEKKLAAIDPNSETVAET